MIYLFSEHRIYHRDILFCHYFVFNNDIFCVDIRIKKDTNKTEYSYYKYVMATHDFINAEKFEYDDILPTDMIYHKRDIDEDVIQTYAEICDYYKEKLIFENI